MHQNQLWYNDSVAVGFSVCFMVGWLIWYDRNINWRKLMVGKWEKRRRSPPFEQRPEDLVWGVYMYSLFTRMWPWEHLSMRVEKDELSGAHDNGSFLCLIFVEN